MRSPFWPRFGLHLRRRPGAGGGGPSGRANGNYRHGGRTKGVADAIRYINALARKARDFKASTTVPADRTGPGQDAAGARPSQQPGARLPNE